MFLEDDRCDMRIMRERERHREKSVNRGREREILWLHCWISTAQFTCRSAHMTSSSNAERDWHSTPNLFNTYSIETLDCLLNAGIHAFIYQKVHYTVSLKHHWFCTVHLLWQQMHYGEQGKTEHVFVCVLSGWRALLLPRPDQREWQLSCRSVHL